MKIVTVGDPHEFNAKLHAACMLRLTQRWSDDVHTTHGGVPPVHTIYMRAADRDGSQMYTLVIHADPEGSYVQGQSLTLGALLRTPDGEVEFHS